MTSKKASDRMTHRKPSERLFWNQMLDLIAVREFGAADYRLCAATKSRALLRGASEGHDRYEFYRVARTESAAMIKVGRGEPCPSAILRYTGPVSDESLINGSTESEIHHRSALFA